MHRHRTAYISHYNNRYTAPGLLPFLEIEEIKTEAAKSISSHNAYKYNKFFVEIRQSSSLFP